MKCTLAASTAATSHGDESKRPTDLIPFKAYDTSREDATAAAEAENSRLLDVLKQDVFHSPQTSKLKGT